MHSWWSDIVCLKYSLLDNKQLSQSMSWAKVKNSWNIRPLLGSWCTIATAKPQIFSTDMLWESCSKWYFEQLLHSICCTNTYSLVVMPKNNFSQKILLNICCLRIINLHRKWKYQKSKNMATCGIEMARWPCFSKCKIVFIFPDL